MPVKDGLIISERNLTLKMSVKQEKQLFLTQRQHPDATKIITEEKGYLSEQVFFFFNVDKIPLFWKKKMPQRTLIRNEEKQASGFKAGETDFFLQMQLFS